MPTGSRPGYCGAVGRFCARPGPGRRPCTPCCGTWSDDGIWQAGRLLRALHDATAGFRPLPGTAWQPWPFRADLEAPGTVISHCDAGPWNLAARDGLPVALIDWDTAGPTGRLDEVAGTAWWNAQLHDDDVAERNGLVTRMIEYAIRDCAAEAVRAQVTPDSADPAPLWTLAWRIRAAAWMIRHRALLENAIAA